MKKYFTFILLFILGCSKSDEIAPEIVIISPGQNQIFAGGQNVNIQVSISDNEKIHSVHLTVLDNTTNGHLIHSEQHLDSKEYSLHQNFSPQSGRSYTIEIEATDHDENSSKKQLTVSAN